MVYITAHLYAYGDSKCTLIPQLLGRPVHNLEDFNCPSPRYFRCKFSCTKPCQRNPSFRRATRHPHSLYEWLMFHLQKISNVTCPDDKTRHTACFFQRYKTAQFYLHRASRWQHEYVLCRPSTRKRHAGPPELNPFSYVEVVSLSFVPNRVLLRRVFLNDDNRNTCRSDSTPRRIITHWPSLEGLSSYHSYSRSNMS